MKHLACKIFGHRITGSAVVRGRFVSYCSRCDRNLKGAKVQKAGSIVVRGIG